MICNPTLYLDTAFWQANKRLAQFDAVELSRILRSDMFHRYIVLALQLDALPAEIASYAEGCLWLSFFQETRAEAW